MQAPSWIALLKLIPVNLHDTLVLITTTNIEVMVQRLVRVEQEYLVLRGRMAGTMDGARVMIMPYDQISNVAFNKRMLEDEVNRVFANSTGWIPEQLAGPEKSALDDTATDLPEAEEKEETVAMAAAQVPATAPAQPQQPVTTPSKAEHASKSVLLARLRARLSGNIKK